MPQTERSDQKSFGWVAVLILLCAGIFAYGALFSTNEILANSAYTICFLTGYYTFFALVIWAIFYVTSLRQRGKLIGFTSFVVIFLSLIVASQITANKRRSNAKLFADSMQHIASAALHYKKMDSKMTSQSAPAFSIAASDKANGDYGEMQNILVQQSNQMAMVMNEYRGQIAAIGWRSIFNAQRIQEDKGFKHSKQMIADALALVGKYRLKSKKVLDTTRAQIEAADMNAGTKADVLKGFDQSMGQSKRSLDSLWNLEQDIVVQASNVFDTLGRSNDWSVQNGRLAYSDPATRDAIVSYITRIKGDTQQEKHLREEAIERSQIQAGKLQHDLN